MIKSKILRRALLVSTAFFPLAAANAQDGSTDTSEQEQANDPFAIIVTAQRRAEDIQDIPVAISAFSGDALEKSGPISLETVAPRVPSFYFGSFGASRPQLYIRGIGTRSFDPGSESSVGVFVDDVYLGRASGSFGSLRDVERVEVLRGPQGTLYGRNTIGGAINVITKAPTDYFTGNVDAAMTNYDGVELSGGVGGPITSDGSLQFRASGWYTRRDGYMTNTLTGTTFQGLDNTGGRLRIAFEPKDSRLRIGLSAEYIEDGNEAAFSGFNRGSGPAENAGTGVITPANPASVFLAAPGSTAIVNNGGFSGALSLDPTLDRSTETYIGRVEYDFDFATITSISALRKLSTRESRDLEGSSLSVIDQFSNENSKQFTQEFRITSDPSGPASFDGKLDWIFGLFYYRDRSSRTDRFELGPDSVIAFLTGGQTPTDVAAANYEIDSYAAFGQATLHLGDDFDLTLGGRYTRDEKRAIQSGTSTLPGVPLVVTPFVVDNSATYESFDPRITATYRISPDVSVYGTFSTGFKSGGFQYVPFAMSQANVLFAPEDIKHYEIGVKSEFLDRRAKLNVAAFHYDYSNLQVSRIVDLGGGAAASLITNAASSSVDGLDVELQLRPSDNFDFNVAYGYLDAKYDSYAFNAATDFSGTSLVRSPKHSLNFGAEWRLPIGDAQLALRGDYAMLADFYHEPGEGNAIFGGATSLSGEDGYGLLDLSATLSYGDVNVTGFARNVGKVNYRRTVLALGSTLSDFQGTPRIYGIKVGYSF